MVENKIAIDLGGTLLRVALVNKGKIKELIKKDTPQKKKELKKELKDSVNQILSKVDKVKGIGISCIGPLNKGVIKNPPNLPFKKFKIEKFVKKEFNLPVEVENDANCAALAEAKLGVKKDNFIVLTLGTGIGGGIIIENELFRGQGEAGELGHILLDEEKYFEDLASGKKIKKITKKKLGKEMLVKELIDKKTEKSEEILNQIAKYLGRGIASLINIFDPQVVVLAGGFREGGKKFLKKIRENAKKYVLIDNKVKIKWSKLDEPGVLGASLLLERI